MSASVSATFAAISLMSAETCEDGTPETAVSLLGWPVNQAYGERRSLAFRGHGGWSLVGRVIDEDDLDAVEAVVKNLLETSQ